MELIQIVEVRTKRFDELAALEDEWARSTEGKRTLPSDRHARPQ